MADSERQQDHGDGVGRRGQAGAPRSPGRMGGRERGGRVRGEDPSPRVCSGAWTLMRRCVLRPVLAAAQEAQGRAREAPAGPVRKGR